MSDNAEAMEVKGFDDYPVKLGDLMRGERATLGKSLLDVQRDLRIKATYIAAIESTDPSVFSTPGFIAGYVRSYARYLGLDPEGTFDQFCKEAAFDGVHAPERGRARTPKASTAANAGARPSHAPQRQGTNFTNQRPGQAVFANDGFFDHVSPSAIGSILVLAILILGIGYGAWAVLRDIQRVEFTPVDTDETVIAAPILQGDGGEDGAPDVASLYRPQGLDVPIMVPRDGPIVELDPDRIGALVPNNGRLNARDTAARLEENAPIVSENLAPKIAVVAAEPAWVKITAADGAVLFERVLDSNESFLLPADAQTASLRAGNSGAVFLTIDGVPYGPVGQSAAVAKNVPLDMAAIREGFPEVSDTAARDSIASPRVITLNDLR